MQLLIWWRKSNLMKLKVRDISRESGIWSPLIRFSLNWRFAQILRCFSISGGVKTRILRKWVARYTCRRMFQRMSRIHPSYKVDWLFPSHESKSYRVLYLIFSSSVCIFVSNCSFVFFSCRHIRMYKFWLIRCVSRYERVYHCRRCSKQIISWSHFSSTCFCLIV